MNVVPHSVIESVACVFAVLLAASYPVRAKLLAKQAGCCMLVLTRRKNILFVFAAAAAAGMLVLLHFREFTPFITVVLYSVAVLAVELAVRDTLYKKHAGVYERLIIVDGRKILKRDLDALPSAMYETEEQAASMRTLKLVSAVSGEIFVGFENETERNAVVPILKKWVTEKNGGV